MHTDWASKHHNTFLHSFPLIGISFSCCLSKINSKTKINLDTSKFCWCEFCIYGFFFVTVYHHFPCAVLSIPTIYLCFVITMFPFCIYLLYQPIENVCGNIKYISDGFFFNSFCVWPDGFKALFILMSFGLNYNERQKGFKK